MVCFFVKKTGKEELRLILDGRIANLFYEDPWGVGLAGQSGLRLRIIKSPEESLKQFLLKHFVCH